MLIVATGITGVVTHDGPTDIPGGGRELGTPFVRAFARSASSPDNQQSVHFIMVNDAGTHVIENLSPARVVSLLGAFPPRWEDWTSDQWLTTAGAMTRRIGDRLKFPRRFPFYLGWNKQLSNVPGTTMFLPLVDCTRGYINALLNLASEPDGQRPLFVDDWRPFAPRTSKELLAWPLVELGALKIPYQPIGGIRHVDSKYVNPSIAAPLGMLRTFIADHEAHFHLQNLMLLAQAMGLGAWVHFCPPPPFLFTGDGTPECRGLGFHMEDPKRDWGAHPPPPPSWMPNPVGIPGVLEALTPPFVASMDDAIDAVLASKYGVGGAYDPALLSKGYADAKAATTYVALAERYDARAVAYVKEVCNYIYDTYGRFPAHVDAFHVPGSWVQICHPEVEYYERTVPPEMFARQMAHAGEWGERE